MLVNVKLSKFCVENVCEGTILENCVYFQVKKNGCQSRIRDVYLSVSPIVLSLKTHSFRGGLDHLEECFFEVSLI